MNSKQRRKASRKTRRDWPADTKVRSKRTKLEGTIRVRRHYRYALERQIVFVLTADRGVLSYHVSELEKI